MRFHLINELARSAVFVYLFFYMFLEKTEQQILPFTASFEEEDDDSGRASRDPNEQQPHEDSVDAERDGQHGRSVAVSGLHFDHVTGHVVAHPIKQLVHGRSLNGRRRRCVRAQVEAARRRILESADGQLGHVPIGTTLTARLRSESATLDVQLKVLSHTVSSLTEQNEYKQACDLT